MEWAYPTYAQRAEEARRVLAAEEFHVEDCGDAGPCSCLADYLQWVDLTRTPAAA